MGDTKEIFLQFHNILRFRLSRIKKIDNFFTAEINNREKMSKTLNNKYASVREYSGKTLMVLSGSSSGVFLCLFTTIISTPVGKASTSINLLVLISNGIVKMFIKTMNRPKIKHRRTFLLTRSTQIDGISIEKITSKH